MHYFWLNETTFSIAVDEPLADEFRLQLFASFQQVLLACRHELAERFSGGKPAITDFVLGYTQITVSVSLYILRQQTDEKLAETLLAKFCAVKNQHTKKSISGSGIDNLPSEKLNVLSVPVCYHESLALDLPQCAEHAKLTVAQFIERHTAKTYAVQAVGFAPGFAYLGFVDADLSQPRHAVPRPRVAAGSVGIAGLQTGIYPADSPGGWKIIGRTPLNCFDARLPVEQASPFYLMRPVRFYAISKQRFDAQF